MSNTEYVRNILNEINAKVAEDKKICGYMDFEEFWLRKHQAYDSDFNKIAFISDVASLENSKKIEYTDELSSYKPRFSSAVIFTKKVIRKSLKFLLLPMIEQQNRTNKQNIRIAQHMRSFVNKEEENARMLSAFESKVLAASYNIDKINEQLTKMADEIETLKKENTELREQIERTGAAK